MKEEPKEVQRMDASLVNGKTKINKPSHRGTDVRSRFNVWSPAGYVTQIPTNVRATTDRAGRIEALSDGSNRFVHRIRHRFSLAEARRLRIDRSSPVVQPAFCGEPSSRGKAWSFQRRRRMRENILGLLQYDSSDCFRISRARLTRVKRS